MKENKEKKIGHEKRGRWYVPWLIVGVILLIIIAFLVWIFANGKETHISQDQNHTNTASLNCVSADPSSPFFRSDNAIDAEHNIKITLLNDKIKNVSYTYDSEYNSEKESENATAVLHGKYNMYMDEQGASRESYNPVFAQDESRLKISIYAESEKLVSALAPILFMDAEEYSGIQGYNTDDFVRIYENKRFSCKVSN